MRAGTARGERDMSDQFDKLKQALNDAPEIKASADAKKAAIDAAMSSFAEEISRHHQGNHIDKRHKERDNKNVVLATLSRWRESMRMKYLLPGTAVLATLALVAVNTYQFESHFTPATMNVDGIPTKPEQERAQDELSNIVDSYSTGQSNDGNRLEEVASVQAPAAPLAEATQAYEAQKQQAKTTVKLSRSRQQPANNVVKKKIEYTPALQNHALLERIEQQSGDRFTEQPDNPLKLTQQSPVSTFSIDVDTAAYSYVRANINRGQLPAEESLRVEELINYFPYDYPGPSTKQVPFSLNTTVIPAPWNENSQLLHIGIKGYQLQLENKLKANLVFLLDTSGSMNQADKLPLLISSFKLLLSTLADEDTVSIVTYAGSAGTVLEPTQVKNKSTILSALSQLQAGGSTAGGEGIELAYQLALQNFDQQGINRIILATDGDFNVGISDPGALKQYIENKRKTGVFLSVLGFGRGNYNDALMQALAQNGNGQAAYIDSLSEARKVLLEEASSTLFPIAKDVKIQMEFNPAVVSEYRLIGYETRQLKREDFNNDKVDAGDIGAGHTVTALYEVTLVDAETKRVDALRYQQNALQNSAQNDIRSEYGYLKLRYKLPNEEQSRLIERPVLLKDTLNEVMQASDEVRFSAAVAAYGQLLRGGKYMLDYSYDDVIKLAQAARGEDQFGYRNEFISLIRLTDAITP